MNNKIFPSLIVIILATCVLHNSYMVKNSTILHPKVQHNNLPAGTCPGMSPVNEDNNSTAKEAISSYPSIMYVDM